MKFLFSHRLWFALARLPFSLPHRPLPFFPDWPVCGQSALAHIPAGRRTMDYMGCEMIAAYNALHFVNRPKPLGRVIETFEHRRWLLLGGHWGADPYAIGRYFAEEGLSFRTFAGRKQAAAFLETVHTGEDRVFVLSYWLGDRVFSGAHAITLVRRNGQLWGYNLHNGQTAPVLLDRFELPAHRFIVGYAL